MGNYGQHATKTRWHDVRKRYFVCTRGLIALSVALTLCSPPLEARPRKKGFTEQSSAEGAALADVRSGSQRLSSGDARGAIEFLTRAIDSGTLPNVARGVALYFRGAAYREVGKFEEALEDLHKAQLAAPDKGQIPLLAFDVALRLDRLDIAYSSALQVAASFPLEVTGLSLDALTRVITGLERARRKEDAHKLRAQLFDANYHGSPAGTTADYLYKELVAGYLDRSDILNAIRVASVISTVDVLLDMMIDARFREVWDAVEQGNGGSLKAAADRQRDRFQNIVIANPGDNQAVHGLIDSWRITGQPASAIGVGEELLKDPVAIGRDPDGYFWVLTKTAYAEVESGQTEAGIRRLAELTNYRLDDYPVLTTHYINRAALLLDQGRFTEAAAAARLAQSRYLSSYGWQWVRAINACAAFGRKEPKVGEIAIAEIKAAAIDNPAAYTLALLCGNKLNDVEQWYVRRLADAELRSDALQALQNFATGPNEGSYFSLIQDRLAQIRKRPAIKLAVSHVGRQLSIDLPRAALSSY